MTQPSNRGPEWSPVGRPPHPPDHSSLWILVAVLAVLAVLAVALIVAVTTGSDDGAETPFAEASPGLPTVQSSTPDAQPDGGASSPAPAEPSALPTDGGPSEDQYLSVARRFVKAAMAGKCAAARRLTDDIFNSAVADENLCEGATRRALRNDDLRDYAISFFGSFGAAVQFDEGRTYLSLIASEEGPLVQVLIAY